MAATVGVAPPDVSYRADIDGLRAVSILLVVAFHAGIDRFAGGYVGVDVFFVLSGYLITGLLLREHDRNGQIRLGEFYARRARRLLPMAALVLVVTTVLGFWVLPPLSRVSLLEDARAAAIYLANWRYSSQATAYSDAEVTDSLLLHYWSLSVEEQYYVLWPLLIVGVGWLIARNRWLRFRPTLLVVLGLVVAASLASSILLTVRLGPAAYYATHTRLWEMGVGALLAFVVPGLRRLPRRVAEPMSLTGLVAIVVSAMAYGPESAFPGWLALVPVLGTGALIVGGHGGGTSMRTVLSTRPLRAMGRWSYAWYLWHWPSIGLALLWNEQQTEPLPRGTVIAAAVAVSFGLAAASHKLVETPLRYASYLRTGVRPGLVLGATLSLVPVLAVTAVLLGGRGLGDEPVPATTTEPAARQDSNWDLDLPTSPMTPTEAAGDEFQGDDPECHVEQEIVEPVAIDRCIFGDRSAESLVVLTGDSHARHWLPALDVIGRERGFAVLSLTKSACTPVDVEIWNSNFERPYDECAEWREDSRAQLIESGRNIESVIVARSRGYRGNIVVGDTRIDDRLEELEAWESGAQRTIEAWGSTGASIIFMRDTPWSSADIPTCLSEAQVDPAQCNMDLTEASGQDATLYYAEWASAQASDEDVHFVDPTPLVCVAQDCSMVTNAGIIKYRDSHHLTATYARFIAPDLHRLLPLDGSVGNQEKDT